MTLIVLRKISSRLSSRLRSRYYGLRYRRRMYDQETISRLGHGLQMRQLRLGGRMSHPIFRDGLRDGRLTKSVINQQAPPRAPQEVWDV